MVNVIKIVLYQDRVLAMMGSMTSPSTPTDSLLKATNDMETRLSQFNDKFIQIKTSLKKYICKTFTINKNSPYRMLINHHGYDVRVIVGVINPN